MLEHGGQLLRASQRWGIAPEHWLDLSTGISPWSWIEERGFKPSARSWHRLPEESDALDAVAEAYYGAPALAVAGSQSAIRALPTLRSRSNVGVLRPSYAEHAESWRRAGHAVTWLDANSIDTQLDRLDVLVLCRPNNPDGLIFDSQTLRNWHVRLAHRGGWLVIDEAFVEAQEASSLIDGSVDQGLVVLRSLGKFFGLAGARAGFVITDIRLQSRLRNALGPWRMAGPTREVASAALQDREWQTMQRHRLAHATKRLHHLLGLHGLSPIGHCDLFRYVRLPKARLTQRHFAQQGILVRRFRKEDALRFGLPGSEADWLRLSGALESQFEPLSAKEISA